ncbi:hypothetical protein NUU61_008901 [Penicillium alfredii]|uniref:Uncharacterized protein n=1 Tax=Penicillium alfredii TaxID=1506179 RepID=A0A9W9EM31_9EURO|nr:uncharacterized protein NUU61_008901 [Penicillium alfredii]KAJ5084322.1 hypothetical protein NUU61_008901 [Penicillium alfredii]
MSSIYQCPVCGHLSDLSHALAVFIENPHCHQCGLSAAESHLKVQDELAALFDKQMTMERPPSKEATISYSITQHYHHSSHVAFPHANPVQEVAVPSTPDPSLSVDGILAQHGLNPSALSPSQLDLFKHADMEQRQRLVQTWLLYSKPLQQQTETLQFSPGEDLEMASSEEDSDDGKDYAEPYMINGYTGHVPPKEPTTGQPYAPSRDPVYQDRGCWQHAGLGPMESQYGAFDEMNRHDPRYGVVPF